MREVEAAAGLDGKTHVITADAGDVASCTTIVPQAIDRMGGLDVVVYASGLCEPCLVKDLTVERFKQHLDVNLTGNFIVARAAALHMNEGKGGSIVNFDSELAGRGASRLVEPEESEQPDRFVDQEPGSTRIQRAAAGRFRSDQHAAAQFRRNAIGAAGIARSGDPGPRPAGAAAIQRHDHSTRVDEPAADQGASAKRPVNSVISQFE